MKHVHYTRSKQPVKLGRTVEKLGTISRPLIWAVQIGIFAVSGITAFLLRFDLNLPPQRNGAPSLRPVCLDRGEDHRVSDCTAGPRLVAVCVLG